MSKIYKVIQKRKDCIGCGLCATLCPQSWKMEDDGLSKLQGSKEKNNVWVGEIHESDLDCNLNAEKECPVNIIKVEK